MTQRGRPPIVTVMGHVDHGKSTLIETLRQINITGKEQGGITQHIGAYQVSHQGKLVTFIDTPGHAAFAKMRQGGVRVTDLVVLVVAADDGVKPQTKEAIEQIKQAKAPFLVAINKIDLPEANVERVKAQLAEAGVYVEGFGGDVVWVPISAKFKQNLDQLLEMILLVAEMQELKGNSEGEFQGVVIAAKLDARRGPVATVLVKNGSLRLGQAVWAEVVEGKVRALTNDAGERVKEAVPSQPVMVLGFKAVPMVGAQVSSKPATKGLGLADGLVKPKVDADKPKLKLIVKADEAGTLEAIKTNLSEEVGVLSSGVGEVSQADVLMAQTMGAKIIGFNVVVDRAAARLAEIEGVEVKVYRIIYELLEDLEKQVLKLLEPTIDEEELGQAVIKAEFEIKGVRIAGAQVVGGVMTKGAQVHLKRGEQEELQAKISSLQQGKEKVVQVKSGGECGIGLSPALDFKIGDVLVSYRKLSVENL